MRTKPTERELILTAHSAGSTVFQIVELLNRHGISRGGGAVAHFLENHDLVPHSSSPVIRRVFHDKTCSFCSWTGTETDYYDHWRENHRTRAGDGSTGASMRIRF